MAKKIALAKKPTIAELNASTRKILKLKADIGRSFYDMGRELALVRDRASYRAKDYANFDEYLAKEVNVSRSNAYKFMRVAKSFDRTFALDAGADRLEAALEYIDATPEDETPADVPDLLIPVRKNGRTARKRLADASHREIVEATRAVRRGSQPSRRRAGAHVATIKGVQVESAWRTLSVIAKAAGAR